MIVNIEQVFSMHFGDASSLNQTASEILRCEPEVLKISTGEIRPEMVAIESTSLPSCTADEEHALESQRDAFFTVEYILSGSTDTLRSLLIIGPEGIGKSWILRTALQKYIRTQVHRPDILSLSLLVSSDSTNPPSNLTPVASIPEYTDEKSYKERYPLLIALLRFLHAAGVSNLYCSSSIDLSTILQVGQSEDKNLVIILFIDNLEDYVYEDDDTSVWSPAGVALIDLLRVSGERTSDKGVSVIIIGTGLSADSEVMSNFSRPPAFDLLRYIFNPTGSDRIYLFKTFLSAMNYELTDGGGKFNDFIKKVDALSVGELAPSATTEELMVRLSRLSPGYLPGDTKMLLEKAINFQRAVEPSIQNLQWEYVLKALAITHPKGLQSVFHATYIENISTTYISNGKEIAYTWEDFGGNSEIKLDLKMLLENIETRETRSKGGENRKTLNSEVNMEKPKGVVFVGKSGSGKSFLAKILASEAKMNFLSVNSTLILSKFFGETEENIRKLFASARSASPCILFFDGFEALSKKRSIDNCTDNDGGVGSRVLSTFLNELDGISVSNTLSKGREKCSLPSPEGVLVVVACNDIDILDPALIRPGRLQHHFVLKDLSDEDACEIIRIETRKFPSGGCVGISESEIVAEMHSSNQKLPLKPIDIVAICSNALLYSLKDNIKGNDDADSPILVTRSHVITAVREYFG